MKAAAPYAPSQRIRMIAADAAQLTGEPLGRIVAAGRGKSLSRARFATMWAARESAGKSMVQIGRALGGRDHSTVLSGLRRAEQLRADDPVFEALTRELVKRDAERNPPASWSTSTTREGEAVRVTILLSTDPGPMREFRPFLDVDLDETHAIILFGELGLALQAISDEREASRANHNVIAFPGGAA